MRKFEGNSAQHKTPQKFGLPSHQHTSLMDDHDYSGGDSKFSRKVRNESQTRREQLEQSNRGWDRHARQHYNDPDDKYIFII